LTRPKRMSTLCRFDDRKGERPHEADVSTKSAPAGEDARLPRADVDQGRAEGAGAPACEGAETADRLTGRLQRGQRLTASAEFQALFQRGRRIDRPALIVLWRDAAEPTRVGFAVSRKLGNAVQRNRARRRLREAYRMARASAPVRAALVIIGRPVVLSEPFQALVAQMRQALGAVPGARTSGGTPG
jgi:ribonuclease P protein component